MRHVIRSHGNGLDEEFNGIIIEKLIILSTKRNRMRWPILRAGAALDPIICRHYRHNSVFCHSGVLWNQNQSRGIVMWLKNQ